MRQLIIRSSFWVFGGQISGQALRLVTNLIMTRLLVPDMFGVMAVANTLIVGLNLCSYFGIHHNIIQSKRGDERIFLDTAWVLQILRGKLILVFALCIAIGLYFANLAGLIPLGSAYADTSLPAIIAVLSLTAFIAGFESTKLPTASRHMALGKLTLIELGSQLIGLIAMIVFALVQTSIWALVIGTLVGTLTKTIASHVALPGVNNKFAWETSAFKELFGFGKWILLTTVMGFFVRNSDKLILAGLISSQLLGIYTIAIFLTNALQDVMTKWASGVVLPVLSKVHRENPDELLKVHYRFRIPFDIVTLFLCGFLYNTGHVIIEVLYDSRYDGAKYMIEILSLWLLGSRTIIAEQCYLAIGKPKFSVPMNVLQLIGLFTLLIPAYHYFGMVGALYVIVISILITLPLTWYFLKKNRLLDWKRELITLPALFVGYGFSKLFIMAYENI
ncbi:MAG TPA: oligosaccharide flippase family protein [Methylotenera sp.]|nr:oligosaccharide flippase family protein [Methylotenera sp.]